MTRRWEGGYSLIELLVVLALLGLITVAISGGIGFGARVWERAQTTVEDFDKVRGTQNFLRTLVGHVYPRPRDANDESSEAPFQGSATRLSFLSLVPDGFGEGGVIRVVLEITGSGDDVRLEMQRATETGDADKRVLLRGTRAAAFSFGTVNQNGEIAWLDAWDEKQGVPHLIRLRAAFAPATNKAWPELIVHPMIDRDAGCIYDPVSFNCRHG